MAKKNTIGLLEIVKIIGSKGTVKKKALCDTGATRSSVDVRVAAKAGIGPIVKSVKVKKAGTPKGYARRAVARAIIVIKGKRIKAEVSIENRELLPYPILIGRDVIHGNFIVDVSKTHTSMHIRDEKKIKRRIIKRSKL